MMFRYRGWFVDIAKAVKSGIRFWEKGYEARIIHEYGGYSLYTRLRV